MSQQRWWKMAAAVTAALATTAVTADAAVASGGAGGGPATLASAQASAGNQIASGNVALMGTASSRAAVAQTQALAPELAAVSGMTQRQQAGQRVIYSYSGLTPPASLLSLIRAGDVGGVLFFGPNYSTTAQFTSAVRKLERANRATTNPARAYPLLLMTDQEGGAVKRLPGAPNQSEKAIGAITPLSAAKSAARQAGRGAAATLRGFGLNVNLAPVLDVYRTAGDFDDQFGRSYSRNQQTVSQLGTQFITAQQNNGVAATAKHFPGLGPATASQNTDERPVTLTTSAATLWSKDEYPYRSAIAAGVDLVMVSWASYPSLGSNRPAGLAADVVKGQLRQRLGFTGVTITDAIGAGALRNYGGIRNRSLQAARAGMDLILAAGETPAEGQSATGGLLAGLRAGTLTSYSFGNAVARILQLRSGLAA